MSLGWPVFAAGLIDGHRREAVADGLKAWIALYFEEYSDATDIDGDTWRHLEFMVGGPGNVSLVDETLEELIDAVTEELARDTGRMFTRYTDEN